MADLDAQVWVLGQVYPTIEDSVEIWVLGSPWIVIDSQAAEVGWGGEFCGVAVAEFCGVVPEEIDGV